MTSETTLGADAHSARRTTKWNERFTARASTTERRTVNSLVDQLIVVLIVSPTTFEKAVPKFPPRPRFDCRGQEAGDHTKQSSHQVGGNTAPVTNSRSVVFLARLIHHLLPERGCGSPDRLGLPPLWFNPHTGVNIKPVCLIHRHSAKCRGAGTASWRHMFFEDAPVSRTLRNRLPDAFRNTVPRVQGLSS